MNKKHFSQNPVDAPLDSRVFRCEKCGQWTVIKRCKKYCTVEWTGVRRWRKVCGYASSGC